MDLSRHEQVALIVRYVNQSFEIQERFIAFYRTLQTDWTSLATLIKSTLSALGLDISALRGQCYDGAANMRGPYKGVATWILSENPLAYYVHCYAHILNLCVVDMVSCIPVVRNAFGILQPLRNFIEEVRSDDFASQTFNHVNELCQKNGYSGPCVPLKWVIPTKLGGGVKSSFEKPEDYYRTEILYSTLDTLIEEGEDHFSKNDLFIFKSLADVLSSESPSDESVGTVSTTYSIDQEDLNSEINLFSRMFKDGIADKSNEEEERTQLEKRLRFFREMALRDTLPNLSKLYVLYLTIPVTTASAERSFSFFTATENLPEDDNDRCSCF
ncbi:UNVERIFIED_CONTAM: hypothetical protein FKN15_014000 [Acipenser sinensis]